MKNIVIPKDIMNEIQHMTYINVINVDGNVLKWNCGISNKVMMTNEEFNAFYKNTIKPMFDAATKRYVFDYTDEEVEDWIKKYAEKLYEGSSVSKVKYHRELDAADVYICLPKTAEYIKIDFTIK